jgi:hypothetical protein
MANPNLTLIDAMRRAAQKLAQGSPYQWGHMGSCNCGNLAQELTKRTKAEIHEWAMMGSGDWHEQVQAFCSTSGLPFDLLLIDMMEAGLSSFDMQSLERLSDGRVLARIALERRNQMRHNNREDVVLYLQTWAEMLEEQLLAEVALPLFVTQPAPLLAELSV